jgi:DNA-binding protein
MHKFCRGILAHKVTHQNLNKSVTIKSKSTGNTTMYLFVDKKTKDATLKMELGAKRSMSENNAVLIGRKPAMNYVLACITLFHSGAKEVSIKARGKAISRAIDVAEVIRCRFLPDVKVTKIGIGTDQIASQEEGSTLTNVSTIEIILQR